MSNDLPEIVTESPATINNLAYAASIVEATGEDGFTAMSQNIEGGRSSQKGHSLEHRISKRYTPVWVGTNEITKSALLKLENEAACTRIDDDFVLEHKMGELHVLNDAPQGSQQGLGPEQASLNENDAYDANRGMRFENWSRDIIWNWRGTPAVATVTDTMETRAFANNAGAG